MLIDEALASLAAVPPTLAAAPAGCPERDLLRSPAALRVGELAARDGLFCFHFEHREPLDEPEHWIAPGETGELPTWTDGALPEPKYRSFRHDLAVASFHPGHRGKWTTHELCHALVGFAWRPGASGLYHATAARLAELLPVVLYYFFDEVRLQRCPRHIGGGPLYRAFCEDCERVAAFRDPAPEDREHLDAGLRFLEDELAAIARTRRTGVPHAHRFGSLDLCSDGLAYARSHGPRLASEAMERLQPLLVEGGGWWTRLDDLEARVLEVARGIALGDPVAALTPSPEAGMERWSRQDLGFRQLTVREQTDGEARAGIEALVDALVDGPIDAVIAGWRALEDEFVLPPTESVFAVGYDLPGGLGRSAAQVRDGLQTVAPLVLELGSDAGVDLAGAFVAADRPERVGIGDRFVRWLAGAQPALSALGALEVSLRAVRWDALAALGPGEGAALCDGARVLRADHDALALGEAVDAGTVSGRVVDGRIALEGWEPDGRWALVVGRDPTGEVVMVAIDPDDADALVADGPGPELAAALAEHGLVRPTRWPL